MKHKQSLYLFLGALLLAVLAAGCDAPCEFTSNTELTLYRVPDSSTDFWGVEVPGQTYEIEVQTADGWVGYEPGVAQAGSIGLARNRYFKLNVLLDPVCLENVPVVTLADVLADFPPPPPDPGTENLVITQVTWAPQILVENQHAEVEVIIENQGDAPAINYDAILFPQLGLGPQNPGGQIAVPDLDPGDSHTMTFAPGIIYSNPGTYTVRVLVTDNLTSTDSTGTAGDLMDSEVQVTLGLCNPFADKNVSLVLLNLPPDTRILPFYLKVEGGVEVDASEFRAMLGEWEANQCGFQGFEDRIYCLVEIPKGEEGSAKQLKFWYGDCLETALIQNNVQIPAPRLVCAVNLGEKNCKAAGGSYQQVGRTGENYECICP
jgi:hypothetical protein